jgi:hypothetical protein
LVAPLKKTKEAGNSAVGQFCAITTSLPVRPIAHSLPIRLAIAILSQRRIAYIALGPVRFTSAFWIGRAFIGRMLFIPNPIR